MAAGVQIYLSSIAIKTNRRAAKYQLEDEQEWGEDGRGVEAWLELRGASCELRASTLIYLVY